MAALLAAGLTACEAGDSATGTPESEDSLAVSFVNHEDAGRVDVLVGGKPFTSYIYTDTISVLKKPVLWPLYTASGKAVTRGYPLNPRPGERTDHPHHIGLWFNYGDINGLDYWNNSDAIPADRAARMGTIAHESVKSMEGGSGRGVLEVTENWVTPDGKTLLKEDTRFVFAAEPDVRIIDRHTTLTAQAERVDMKDNKEGVLGLRLTRALEHPSKDSVEVYTDASGLATTVKAGGNEGVTGRYISSEGFEGDDVWGTRGKWVMLNGVLDGDSVTVAILDHPRNVGFPTYWHARGYGLFAANPLGQAALSGDKETLNYALDPGQSTTFHHRILIFSGKQPTREEMAARYDRWASEPS